MTRTPRRWATDISAVLNAVRGIDHFPISVIEIAREFSMKWFPEDPIIHVAGDNLPGFDGALIPAPKGQKGWGIVYNNAIKSIGRINFTLAHEWGHYLIHRLKSPKGIQCVQQDIVRWDSAYRQMEYEANAFAAYMLMPFDDYRRRIAPESPVTFDMISDCAIRYGVSLLAATLRWIEYTATRAVLVVSRDGFMLWARSSTPALKSGVFFRTANRAVPVPDGSLIMQQPLDEDDRAGVDMEPGVWFEESCREMTIFSEHYDFTISLLQLGRQTTPTPDFEKVEEEAEDLGELIRRNHHL
jgi:uncharacterized protein DUF955